MQQDQRQPLNTSCDHIALIQIFDFETTLGNVQQPTKKNGEIIHQEAKKVKMYTSQQKITMVKIFINKQILTSENVHWNAKTVQSMQWMKIFFKKDNGENIHQQANINKGENVH